MVDGVAGLSQDVCGSTFRLLTFDTFSGVYMQRYVVLSGFPQLLVLDDCRF